LFAGSVALAQQKDQPQPTPDDKVLHVPKEPIDIKIQEPLKVPKQYRFEGGKPLDKTHLRFTGDNRTWSFVQFAQLPHYTKLIVEGHPDGYDASQELEPNKWYPFKKMLPAILEIENQALAPVRVSFWFGSVKSNRQPYLDTLTTGEDVRKFAENPDEITRDVVSQSLIFTWDATPETSGGNTVKISPDVVSLEVPEIGEPSYQHATFTGDSKGWIFVRVKQLPRGVVLVPRALSEDTLTIPSGTLLGSDEWIAFKNSLTLDVSLNKGQLPEKGSQDLTFETSVTQSVDQTKEEAIATIKRREVVSNNSLHLKVLWGPPIDASWPWLKIGLAILGLLVIVGVAIALWRRRSRVKQATILPRVAPTPKPLDGFGNDDHTPRYRPDGTREIDGPGRASGAAQSRAAAKRMFDTGGGLSTDEIERNQAERLRTPSPGHPLSKSPASPPESPAARPLGFDKNELEQLIDTQVAPLRAGLNQKVGQQDLNILSGAVKALEGSVTQLESRLDQRITAKVKPVEDLLYEKSLLMEQNEKRRDQLINQMRDEGETVKKQLGEFLAQLGQVETRLQTRLVELHNALNRRTVPDSFYARTVGAVLGQQIEALQDGNFEKLIGEQLNQFFETGVERGEKLQELRVRAEEINSALKNVSLQMEKLNAPASVEARQPMQRVEAFVNELSGLQSQMQSRRATIETTLNVPVSMHAGARQTFLDELGRGIKREIDKLNDPQNYFEGELERLITADLIAIVDICDKTIAPPPGRPELEAALKQLFERAGLSPILPHQRDPFKTGEQDLIEMAQGGGGPSLTVAQVITRGFYYTHRDNKTLLRKAGVTVYR